MYSISSEIVAIWHPYCRHLFINLRYYNRSEALQRRSPTDSSAYPSSLVFLDLCFLIYRRSGVLNPGCTLKSPGNLREKNNVRAPLQSRCIQISGSRAWEFFVKFSSSLGIFLLQPMLRISGLGSS